MGRFDGITVPVTSQEMRQYAAALVVLAETHEQIAKWMEEKELGAVPMRNFQAATDALDAVRRFLGVATEGIVESLTNDPHLMLQAKAADLKAAHAAELLITERRKKSKSKPNLLDSVEKKIGHKR